MNSVLDNESTYDIYLYQNQAQFVATPQGDDLPLPFCANKNSILVFADQASKGRTFLDYQMVPGCSKMEEAQGKMVTVLFKEGRKATGILVNTTQSSSNIAIFDSTKKRLVTFTKYKSIKIHTEQVHPSIVMNVPSSLQPEEVRVSFLTSSLSWKASYVTVVDKDRIAWVRANANIENSMGEIYEPNKISFIVGNLHGSNHYSSRRSMAESCIELSSYGQEDAPVKSLIAEYEQYVKENSVAIPTGESSVNLFTIQLPTQEKIYTHYLGGKNNNIVHWGFRITAPQYLPAGSVSVYDAEMRCIGNTVLPSIPNGVTSDLILGSPNNLSMVSLRESVTEKEEEIADEFTRTKKRSFKIKITTTYTITCINNLDKETKVLIQLPPLQSLATLFIVVRNLSPLVDSWNGITRPL